MTPQTRPPPEDIEDILRATATIWRDLREARIFFTGATGFFGIWMLESLLEANRRFSLGVDVTLLTRNPEGFARRAPHLARDPSVKLVTGSVVTLQAEVDQRFDFVIHLATEADTASTLSNPLDAIEVIADGTRRTLDFALQTKAQRMLFTSSGSVYARRAASGPIDEAFPAASDPTDTQSVYAISGQAKRHAEALCAAYASQHGLAVSIARCFAFLGPGLPLDGKFAAGNFILDALAGRPIVIKGDGTPVRTYLYPSDLTIWLWSMLLRGAAGRAYNVGSEHAITLRDLAELTARELGCKAGVTVLGQPSSDKDRDYYVPATLRARLELGLTERIDLPTAVRRTAAWCHLAKSE